MDRQIFIQQFNKTMKRFILFVLTFIFITKTFGLSRTEIKTFYNRKILADTTDKTVEWSYKDKCFIPYELKTDLQKEELKGNVKTVQQLTFSINPSNIAEGFILDIYEDSNYNRFFNTNGNILEDVQWSSDFTLKDFLHNNINSKTFVNKRVTKKYDNQKRLIIENIDTDENQANNALAKALGSPIQIEYSYNYNKNKDTLLITKGKEGKVILVFKDNKLLSYDKINAFTSSGMPSNELVQYQYFKDSIIETYTSYYTSDKVSIQNRIIEVYNKDGLRLKKISYTDGGEKIDYVNYYYYDKKNDLKKVKSSLNMYCQKIKYPKKDKYGNWLIMKQFSEHKTITITHRTITYYE